MTDKPGAPRPQSLEDFLGGLNEKIPEAAPIEVVDDKANGMALLKKLEDNILHESLSVIEGALQFQGLDPNQDLTADAEPPAEWIIKYGEEEAWKKFRMAQAAWLPQKDAPMGFKVATATAASILKARSGTKQMPQQLNIAAQMVFGENPKLPSKKVEE